MGVCSYGAAFSISLPEGLPDVSAHTLAGISKDTLIGAFKSAFLFGGVLGICALFVHPFLRKG